MKKAIRWLLTAFLAAAVLGFAAIGITYLIVAPDLPEVDSLQDVQLQVPLRVYSRDGRLIGLFGEMRRIPATLEQIPDRLEQAFLAGEDARYYEHPGVDYQGISRAVWILATTGEKSVGGSTITQQLARNFFLTSEKTFTRKIKEIFLALRIERELSKDDILELYLNKIFLGYRAYGVGAAAEVYYGKDVAELSLAQAAMIAALPKAPSRINPINSPERALERRNYVLGRMRELEYITDAEYQAAVNEEDQAFYHGAKAEISAPYLSEMVRVRALQLLGEEAYTGGFEIHTTIDSRLQMAANQAVAGGLAEYDERHGYRGPEARVDLGDAGTPARWNEILEPYRPVSGLMPGLVTEVEDELALVYLRDGQTVAVPRPDWAARFINRNRTGAKPETMNDVVSPGDVIRVRLDDEGNWQLGQIPEVEAALISLDPKTGDIRALVGGYDFSRSKYNRVVQSRRQPGSGFKPFVYSAALERGFTTASLINDAPIVFDDPELERTWKPQNFSEKFYGPTRMREAMVNSRNLVSIRLLRDTGIEFTREHVARFGFDPSELPRDLTLALGSASLTPLSLARGYAAFANGGYLVDPEFIREIRNADGDVIYRTIPPLLCDDCAEDQIELAAQQPTEPGEPVFRPLEISREEENADPLGVPEQGVLADTETEARPAPRAVSAQNAYLIRSMMMDVVRRGTGVRAMQLGRSDLAGKTGTTNEQRDAWFTGYNDHLVTSVWVGFDNFEPLGRREVGGRAALPIWMAFMEVALEGLEDRQPVMPPGLAQARIDPDTGLLARLDNPDAIMEVFEVGKLPPMEAEAEGEREDAPSAEDPYEIF
ncbi:penicillin-binding protein 1A [Elongatibacter sediminis]|uniref:Penicillin-binding protein 1A n=1 Tax=Elongatibacter sediminis TaxID=3119006 RepID=A0AAW9RMD9_9GAMM